MTKMLGQQGVKWTKAAIANPRFRAGLFARAIMGDYDASLWCSDHNMPMAAASEGANTQGGFLVPEEIEAEIYSARAVSGVVRREARIRPMGSDVRSFPRRKTAIVAGFTAESVAATEDDLELDGVKLVAKKGAVLVRVSADLWEDEVSDLGAWFTEELGAALAVLEDGAAFVGDGSQTYAGMIGLTQKLITADHAGGKQLAAAGHDTFLELDSTDLANVASLLPEQFIPNAKWFCSGTALQQTFMRLGATQFGQIQTPTGPRPLMQYGGAPIVATPTMPGTGSQTGKAMLLYGDMRMSTIMGSRRGIRVRISEHRYLEFDQLGFLVTERFDIVNHNVGDATTPGAMIGLIGA